jgi:hypothetical protein
MLGYDMVARYLTQESGMPADPMRSGLTLHMVVVIKFRKKKFLLLKKNYRFDLKYKIKNL